MDEFEEHRAHLRAVAYRMLGSLPEAEDAVQEAWLRMHRADVADIRNMRGWLTTVVAHICLDALRARSSRPEQPLDETTPAAHTATTESVDPEQQAQLADSVGVALRGIQQQPLQPVERGFENSGHPGIGRDDKRRTIRARCREPGARRGDFFIAHSVENADRLARVGYSEQVADAG